MQDVDVVALLLFALPSRNLTIIWLELGILWTLLIALLLLIAFLTAHLLLKLGSAAVSFMIPTKPATIQYIEIEQVDANDCSDESSSSTSTSASFPSSATPTVIARTLLAESEPIPLLIDTTSHLSSILATFVEHTIRAGLAFHSAILLNALVLSLDETSLDSSYDSDNTPSPAFSDFSYSPESGSDSGSDSDAESVASSVVDDDDDLACPSAPIVELSTTTLDVPPPFLTLSKLTLNASAPTFAPSPSPRIAVSNLSATAPSFAPAPTHPTDALLPPPPKDTTVSPSIHELNVQAEMAAAEHTKLEGDRFLREVNAKWEQSPEGLARASEWREELKMRGEWRRWSAMSWESRQREPAACRMERERATQWARWQMEQQRGRPWGR